VGTRYGAFHDTFVDTNILNEQVRIINADYHTRIVNPDGTDFHIYTQIDKWEAYLLEKAPEDTQSIRKMCRDMRRCCKLVPFEMAPSLRSPLTYLKALFRSYPSLFTIVRYRNKTSEEYFNELNIKNEWLRTSLHHIYGKTDFTVVSFLLMLSWYSQKNAGHPEGGSLHLSKRMAQRYKELGGEILFKKKVTEILVENNRAKGVQLEDGIILNADYVISASDGYNTLFNLLKGKYLTPEVTTAYREWKPFEPLVQVSFGVNAALHTDYPVQWIVSKGRKIGQTSLSLGYRILNYNFDHTMAPEGKSCIIIRFESPWYIWENMSQEDYTREKEAIEKEARRMLEENYPGTASAIEVCDVATPHTTIRYTGAWKASYEGFRPSCGNITKQLPLTMPGLSHFYMAGQWLFPGGGIPPSVQSGKWVIQMINKKEKCESK
jgi:phytoene dehydrogenase-like protein